MTHTYKHSLEYNPVAMMIDCINILLSGLVGLEFFSWLLSWIKSLSGYVSQIRKFKPVHPDQDMRPVDSTQEDQM